MSVACMSLSGAGESAPELKSFKLKLFAVFSSSSHSDPDAVHSDERVSASRRRKIIIDGLLVEQKGES